jgi:methylenetetrahydrofolate reductase (NADPH)
VTKDKVTSTLENCRAAGIMNIVALRGDPPLGETAWKVSEEGFTCALDLVQYIRKEHGDYFNISVAGYPEGHPNSMTKLSDCDSSELSEAEKKRSSLFKSEDNDGVDDVIYVCKDADYENELKYLKKKVDAGANCIITQLFFDVNVFLSFVDGCRAIGITVPIIPGIMCVSSVGGFKRMTSFCRTRVPSSLMDRINAVTDDMEMKELSIDIGTEMCLKLIDANIRELHFYTLNTSNVMEGILNNLRGLSFHFFQSSSLQSFSCSTLLTNDTVFDAMVDRVLVNGNSENEGSSTNQILSVAN